MTSTTSTTNTCTAPYPWRRHQQQTLDAFDAARTAGRSRMYAAIPPGGGKTLVGLEMITRLQQPAIVLTPNTAIQGQWLASAALYEPALSASSEVGAAQITVVTYQALISERTRSVHAQGREMLAAMTTYPRVTVVCDEIHHLLGAWGDAVRELADLANATVIGLTGTPPVELTASEADAMHQLFGEVIHETSTPALVRDGYLSPWRELTYVVEPTDRERRYLQADHDRLRRFLTDLADPTFADVAFTSWLASHTSGPLASAAASVARAYGAHELNPADVDMSDLAAVLTTYLSVITHPAAIEAIKDALPALGYRVTRNGVQGTTSPANRCLAHSHAKHHAAADIIAAEWGTRNEYLRALVLCDFETYSGTPDAGLVEQNLTLGSARHVLEVLSRHPLARALSPVLVTGKTMACSAATAPRLLSWLGEHYPQVKARASGPVGIDAADGAAVVRITGKWTSREWVQAATRWFSDGCGHILIGTRALLGEGWDAPRSNVLIDLTTAATAISAAQARGRVLRTDTHDPFKTAHVWSVAATTGEHPEGRSDWNRLLRKHDHLLAISEDGVVVSGSEHLPGAIATAADGEAINAASWECAQRPDITHALWHVGAGYRDDTMRRVAIEQLHEGDMSTRYFTQQRWYSRQRSAPHAHTLAESIAAATAEALCATGALSVGFEGVRVWIDDTDRMHAWIEGVPARERVLFLETLEQALEPTAFGQLPALTHPSRKNAYVTWHAIPDTINAKDREQWIRSWETWVNPREHGFATSTGRGAQARTITLWN